MLSLSLTFLMTVGGLEPPTALTRFRELAADYLNQTSDVSNLFKRGEEMAHLYFVEASASDRVLLEAELGALLRGHRDLGPLFIPLGNSFHLYATRLFDDRQSETRKIKIVIAAATAVAGVLLISRGLQLNILPPLLTKNPSFTLIAGGLASAGIGYFAFGALGAWALLPYDESVETADEFLDRYPHGIDFLEAASDTGWSDPLEALDEN